MRCFVKAPRASRPRIGCFVPEEGRRLHSQAQTIGTPRWLLGMARVLLNLGLDRARMRRYTPPRSPPDL